MKDKLTTVIAWIIAVGIILIFLGLLVGINMMVWSKALGW